MPYLQLADNATPAYLGQNDRPLPQDLYEHMLQVPTDDGRMVWVREDALDHIPDAALYNLMQMQPHMSGIRDWFGRMRERRQTRQAQRQETRGTRRDIRTARMRQGGILERTIGAVGQILPGAQTGTRGLTDTFPQITGGASFGVAKWWQNPLVIGGIVVGAGMIVYFATRKKR